LLPIIEIDGNEEVFLQPEPTKPTSEEEQELIEVIGGFTSLQEIVFSMPFVGCFVHHRIYCLLYFVLIVILKLYKHG